MTSYELLAIVPDAAETPTLDSLQVVACGDATAVLIAHPHQAIRLPASRKDALRTAAQRQAWLEALMPYGPVLPFRPHQRIEGADVAGLVAANRPLIDQLGDRFRGKAQFQITVGWDCTGVLARFRDTPELSPLFAQGTTTPERLERGLGMLKTRLGDQISAALAAVATDIILLPVLPDMLANTVVLQPTDALDRLDQVLEDIDAIWTEGLAIRQIGPAPAASFASLAAQKVGQDGIAIARDVLNIDGPASPAAITQARKAALLNTPGAADEIKHSAAILQAVHRAGLDHKHIYLCTAQADGQHWDPATSKVA